MPRTRIKICGFTREADVDAALDAGADALGFMLWPGSARAVSVARAAALAARMPPFTTPVLLFVNATAAEVAAATAAVPNAVLQFHGDETPAQCAELSAGRPWLRAARVAPDGQVVLAAVPVAPADPAGGAGGGDRVGLLDFAAQFHAAQALLLDAHTPGYGGAGKVFDWSLVQAQVGAVRLPVVLSGGLNPANVIDGITRLRPWAVDVSSGVEAAKGVKDASLMRRFCQAVRDADAALASAN